MTFSEEQIEWIVVEVLRRLGVAGDERSSSPVGAELAIPERVVTLRLIEGRLKGVSRLLVQAGAVITPAAKDELKQRQIELVRKERI